jgi:two-component system sensor histidine kinase YesM
MLQPLIRHIPGVIFDKLRSVNLKRKLLLIIFSTVIVILIFSFFVFTYAGMISNRRDRETNLRNYFIQSRERLDAYLKQIDFIAYTIMFSSWVQQLIDYRSSSISEVILYQTNARRFLQSLSSINNDISMILDTGRERIFSDSALQDDPRYSITGQPWFPALLENKRYAEYGSSRLFRNFGNTWSLTLYYVITNVNNFDVIGYFAVNIPAEKFAFLLSESQYDWIEVADSGGNSILNSPSDFFMSAANGPDASGGRGWILYEDTLMDGHWLVKLYRYLPAFSFEDIQNYYLLPLLLIPVLFFFALITFSFSRYLTNPIVRCRNAMLEIQNNNFGITLENHYRDEIGGLIQGFNEMSSNLVTLRQQNAEIEKLRREAEIDILQQKVNPHFLYNTLEIINALILDGQHGEAVEVCELLGQIYHYNLLSHKWVALRDEIEYVKQYLKIIQYKMSALSVTWEIAAGAEETDSLRLILQPLVENAARHGLRHKAEDACLTIMARSAAGKTSITVMDNGSGIAPDTLFGIEETLAEIRRGAAPGASHIGIPNVYRRLYLEYGEALEFSIESRPRYGTEVRLIIPQKGPDDQRT